MLPAMLIVLALAWAYVRFGTTPLASGVLYGILPVVIAIVAQALWGLGQKAVKNWLTDRQLIDAIAIGQVTPGPVFTTATFIGYLLGGVPGAVLATLGIFLPSFVFVAVGSLFIKRVRGSPWAAAFLDGVNAASLGLMLGVTLQLTSTALIDPPTIIIALASLALLLGFQTHSTWLIAGGALVGLLHVIP